jgi:GTP-binding protein
MAIQRGKTEFLMGIDKVEQLSEWLALHPTVKGVAMIGRSNVGKSSLINAMFGNSTARVSKTPGRTRQVNVFRFQWRVPDQPLKEFCLFDVPGYGHAEVSKEMGKNWQILLDTFFHQVSGKVLLLNIQDARHPLQDADMQFNEYLKNFTLETHLVLNKMDKLKTQKERAALQKQMNDVVERFQGVKRIYFTSAEKLDGIPALVEGMMGYLLRA